MRIGVAEVSNHRCLHFSVVIMAPTSTLRLALPKSWPLLRQAWQTSRTPTLGSSPASFVIGNARVRLHACRACPAGYRHTLGAESR